MWKVRGKGSKIIEVWESYNGDLYFISEKHQDGQILCYARLYSMPEFAEWGWNDINYLKEAYGQNKLWKVPERNWSNIDSYEDNLLVEVD